MIEEMMNEITAAEAQAKGITDAANAQATEILSGIGAEIDALYETNAADAKKEYKAATDKAEKKAESKAQEFIGAETEKARAAAMQAEEKLQTAVDYITAEILK